MTTLVLVVSGRLEEEELLLPRLVALLRLGDIVLIAEKDEPDKPWGDLKERLLEDIWSQQPCPEKVLIAAHKLHVPSRRFQERCPQQEEEIRRELAQGNVQPAVQVWGFHHVVAGSPIWASLIDSLKYVDAVEYVLSTDVQDSRGREHADQLLKAFKEVALSVSNQVAVLRHRVVHLFLAPDMKLQRAEEMRREGDDAEAHRLREEVGKLLENKIKDADDLLRDAKPLLTAEVAEQKRKTVEQWLIRVGNQLEKRPALEAREFRDWLCDLREALAPPSGIFNEQP